jgi:ectoine hydroxylase-related dioxygenase (phytanoyl-CoA dioxygenase family)
MTDTSQTLELDRAQHQRMEHVLSPAAIAEYWERGYWISPKLFDDDQIARLRAAHAELWAARYDHEIPSQYGLTAVEPGSTKVRIQFNAFWLNDEIRRAVTSPILGQMGAQLMGADGVRLWHDQAIYKPGTGGQAVTNAGNIGWHQDFGYWQSSSFPDMCTAWVALQDTDLTNGGMRTIVGSHKWGLIKGSDGFSQTDLEQQAQRFAQLGGTAWLDEPCLLKAGQASFHHCLTFHGSGPNLSQQPRLSVVAHMMPADTVYRAGRQWHPNLVFFGPNAYDGQPFAGDYWPVMWPPAA